MERARAQSKQVAEPLHWNHVEYAPPIGRDRKEPKKKRGNEWGTKHPLQKGVSRSYRALRKAWPLKQKWGNKRWRAAKRGKAAEGLGRGRSRKGTVSQTTRRESCKTFENAPGKPGYKWEKSKAICDPVATFRGIASWPNQQLGRPFQNSLKA